MRFIIASALLAAVPVVIAADTASAVPESLRQAVEAEDGCEFPSNFTIKDFAGKSNKTGELGHFSFNFVEKLNNVNTTCSFNHTSQPIVYQGYTARYPCDKDGVAFIWDGGEQDLLTMVQPICPGSDNVDDYEASGSVQIPLDCCDAGKCESKKNKYHGDYVSFNPPPPTVAS